MQVFKDSGTIINLKYTLPITVSKAMIGIFLTHWKVHMYKHTSVLSPGCECIYTYIHASDLRFLMHFDSVGFYLSFENIAAKMFRLPSGSCYINNYDSRFCFSILSMVFSPQE